METNYTQMIHSGIQTTTIAFSIFMIYFTYFCYKRTYFKIGATIGWLVAFIALTIGSLFPSILEPFIEVLGFARLFDLYSILGFIFLTIVTFTNFLQVHKLQNKLDSLIQDQAIEESKNSNSLDG